MAGEPLTIEDVWRIAAEKRAAIASLPPSLQLVAATIDVGDQISRALADPVLPEGGFDVDTGNPGLIPAGSGIAIGALQPLIDAARKEGEMAIGNDLVAQSSGFDSFPVTQLQAGGPSLPVGIAIDPTFQGLGDFQAEGAVGFGPSDILGGITGAIGSVLGAGRDILTGIGSVAADAAGAIGGAVLQNPSVAIDLARQLAAAGVIRGSVGNALAPMVPMGGGAMAPAMMQNALAALAQNFQAINGVLMQAGRQPLSLAQYQEALVISAETGRPLSEVVLELVGQVLGGVVGGVLSEMGGEVVTDMIGGAMDEAAAMLARLLGGGGGGMGVANCPSLFRQRRQGMYLPSRIQVTGPDGNVYVLANLGRATRGSRETSVLKRLAKDNGFVAKRRTASGGR